MNARLYKETRTLLPVFGATVLAVLAERLLLPNGAFEGLAMATLMAGCAFLGASSFGEEFQHRTMPLLLSQPLARGNLWREKMLVLGIALVAVFAVYVLSAGLGGHYETLLLASVPLVVFCSAPAHVLTAKNTLVGALTIYAWPLFIWFLMLAVYGITSWAMPRAGRVLLGWFERDPYPFVVVPALVYLAYSYRAGHRRFLALEAIDTPGTEIGLPARVEALLARPLQGLLPGYSGVFASLLRKELHLQRVSYLIAGLVCALMPVALAVQVIHKSDLTAGLLTTGLVICVFIVPFITAGLSVAEERSLGVAQWQRTMPPSALRQWMVKMLVTFGTCALLGLVLPVLMLVAGHALAGFPSHGPDSGAWILAVVPGGFVLLSLTVFASSISSNTFQGLLLAVLLSICLLGAIVFGAFLAWPRFAQLMQPGAYYDLSAPFETAVKSWAAAHHVSIGTISITILWALLIAAIGTLILPPALCQILAYRNFRNGAPSIRGGCIQSIIIVMVLCACSSGFFLVTSLLNLPFTR